MLKYLLVFSAFCFTANAFAAAHVSNVHEVKGIKFPNSPSEGFAPVEVSVNAPRLSAAALPGFSELVPFALRSPDQEEAGSCLYMSLTGIAEWWMARLNPRELRTPDGPIDLSERYLMNIAGIDEDSNGIANWKTDSVYLFNSHGGTLRNRDYRFTKGWYSHDSRGNLQKSAQGMPGAEYDATYNWIDERESASKAEIVKLPKFQREVLFADPASNQWNTGVMPANIVEQIKTALKEKKAPVHIIYNHFGYWHATVILGYDDNADNSDCKFVRHFMDYMTKKAQDYRDKAGSATDQNERNDLLARAQKAQSAVDGAKSAWDRGGGCHPKGSFYVRDSIYGDPQGPVYDYDPGQKGEEAPYVKSIVQLEYDWVRTMANHATQISIVP